MNSNKYSNTELLNQYNLPIFHNMEELASSMGLSKKIIYLFSLHSSKYYKKFKILKKNNKEREICAPNAKLKLVQKWLLINIFSKLVVSNQAMAFKKGINGIKLNASMHNKNLYILQIDLVDFFTSIKQKQVFKLLRRKGYNGKISAIITSLCTYNGCLPQGGITSPIISNLICNSLDKRLVGLCSKRDINYSRYADDMTFSSNEKSSLKRIVPIITDIIKQEGFAINKEKTRFSCPGSRKVITGVNINSNELKAKKELKRQVRAMIHKAIMQQEYEQNDKIRGLVAYINSIEQNYKEKICNYIESFEEKLMFEPNSKEIFEKYNKNKIFKECKNLKDAFD